SSIAENIRLSSEAIAIGRGRRRRPFSRNGSCDKAFFFEGTAGGDNAREHPMPEDGRGGYLRPPDGCPDGIKMLEAVCSAEVPALRRPSRRCVQRCLRRWRAHEPRRRRTPQHVHIAARASEAENRTRASTERCPPSSQ